jgi:Zn-dependent peptidase ImmA (M78 family)
MKVDRLSYDTIEGAALSLIAGYKRKYPKAVMFPVPVDDIVECHLELDFGFTDLIGSLKVPDVLGALWFDEHKVRIDQSLDPDENPAKAGRYRYTVAHECGHWVLHRRYFLNRATQPMLFDAEAEPSIVCRSSQNKEPIEWQADTFASYLLMPKDAVFQVWQKLHGSLEPYYAADEIAELSARWGVDNGSAPTVRVSREIAQALHVSGQAMQIRLERLGLIKTNDSAAGTLFASSPH